MIESVVASGIDIWTLYIAATVVAGFFGIAFLAFHIIDMRTRGILQWGIAYLLIALALLANLFRHELPVLVYGVGATAFFVVGVVLLDAGTRVGLQRGVPVLDVALPVVAVAVNLVFALIVPSLAVRLEVLFVSVAIGTTRTAVRLICQGRRATDGLRVALLTFSVFYTVLAATMITIALLALVLGPIQDVVGRHPIHAVLLPALMLFFIGSAMSKLWVHYMRAYQEVQRAATTDPLTNVRNRRYLLPELERIVQRSKREGRRLACMMLDADRFKSINDTHGHQTGDDVLRTLAKRITEAVRDYDLVGRYGGEEFLIVVPELDPEIVVGMAHRLHQSIRSETLAGLQLTVSVGVAFLGPNDNDADDLVKKAADALYRAKRAGRDRVVADAYPTETFGGDAP